MVSSRFPGLAFDLREAVWLVRQEGNRSLVHWELWIDKVGSPLNYYSNANKSSWVFHLDGREVAKWGPGNYDFRNARNFHIGGGDVWIDHDAAGNKGVAIAAFASFDILGYTALQSALGLPRIPKAPGLPRPIGIDTVTANSLRYRFNGPAEDGGTPVREYEVQVSTSAGFGASTIVQSFKTTSGTHTISGLTPGQTYYVRVHARNDVGWGGWTAASEAKTLTAIYYIDPATNVAEPVVLHAWTGSAWEVVDLYVDPELDGTFAPTG